MTREIINSCRKQLTVDGTTYNYMDIFELKNFGYTGIGNLPYSIRILLESALRQYDGDKIDLEHIEALANWHRGKAEDEVPFMPSRILLQDFTGVPAVVDLAAMREAVARAGKDPSAINPVVPVDLVIDHSLMVDAYGSADALQINMEKEFQRNGERYKFLKWAGDAFDNFRVIPPGTGIIHQVNLEYLASIAGVKEVDGSKWLHPDSLVGTDSHTTMINGLGVLGWGVGGIEAEAAMLGQPIYLTRPEVIGVELTGRLQEGATATDLALTVTEMLRQEKVVGKFVEYFGDGARTMKLADRATVANMSPEYGATMGFFPPDDESMAYLRQTGRDEAKVNLAAAYLSIAGILSKEEASTPIYTKVLTLDLATVESSLAGPKRPQDRIKLSDMSRAFKELCDTSVQGNGFLENGSLVLAAITSCTNTSNPSVMIGAGLVAKKAVEAGLKVPSYVKTSLTPGSQVVTDYLSKSGVLTYLEQLGFNIAGYGCATCIGNSGPLPKVVADAIDEGDLTVASVLSGNRNFEGRIHSQIQANYLASPMLVVAYALAGKVTKDITIEPIGLAEDGREIYLKDIWPSSEEIAEAVQSSIHAEDFKHRYGQVEKANEMFNAIEAPKGTLYQWDPSSTYIQLPTFFQGIAEPAKAIDTINEAKVLALLGDSVTTDHISPAGAIGSDTPAGQYLAGKDVPLHLFNSYGSRRGNHEVMMRGTFANIRIRNRLLESVEGGFTRVLPGSKKVSIFDGAQVYKASNTPLLVIAGKEYGTGSSRDWAAKGTWLLGVKAVIAESYERIHRSNLVGMGVLPLQFRDGESQATLGLTGEETYTVLGLSDNVEPGQSITVEAVGPEGGTITFDVNLRMDSTTEIDYYRNGGILHTLLREMISK